MLLNEALLAQIQPAIAPQIADNRPIGRSNMSYLGVIGPDDAQTHRPGASTQNEVRR